MILPSLNNNNTYDHRDDNGGIDSLRGAFTVDYHRDPMAGFSYQGTVTLPIASPAHLSVPPLAVLGEQDPDLPPKQANGHRYFSVVLKHLTVMAFGPWKIPE